MPARSRPVRTTRRSRRLSAAASLSAVAAVAGAMLVPAAQAGAAITAPLPPAPIAGQGAVVETGRVTFVADGDTVDVDIDGDGTSASKRVRIAGVQAMELSTYSHTLDRIVGDCHGPEATRRMHSLVYGKRVRLTAMSVDAQSSKSRLRRSVAYWDGAVWRDAGTVLLNEGLALWLPNKEEYTYNQYYSVLAERAAAAGRGVWDRDSCKVGPYQSSSLQLTVNWDAPGRDSDNLNGEYVAIRNAGTTDVPIAGWWVRDTMLRRFVFPAGTVLRAGDTIYVHAGAGTNTGNRFYWDQDGPVFENASGAPVYAGDGGYLYDPDGDLRAWQQYPDRYPG